MLANFEIAETERFLARYPKVLGSNADAFYSKIKNTVYPQLSDFPFLGRNIKKLRGYAHPTWRYRFGDYRILYEIDTTNHRVFILSIAHRKDAYKS